MNLRYLNYIVKIAETKSFTKAAQSLYITQPTLSQFVYSVEEELNVQLFERSSKGVRLTEAGEILVAAARKILDDYEAVQQRISDLSAPKRETVVIALSSYRTTFFAPKIISQFRKQFPACQIVSMEKSVAESKEAIHSGSVDFAISSCLSENEDLGYTKITKEEIMVAVPPQLLSGQEAALRQTADIFPEIDLNELKNECFLLLEKNQPLHDLVEQFFQRTNFVPKNVIQCSTMNSANSMMMNGLGCTFVTDLFVQGNHLYTGNYYYHIKRLRPKRDVYLLHRKSNTLNELEKSFISMVRQIF